MAIDSDDAMEIRVYKEVFKIPPQNCPPDYFTLLGIAKDCADVDTIVAASKKRGSLLHKGLPPELHTNARLILRRIDRARICLSDINSRAAYLQKLSGNSTFQDVSLRENTNLQTSKLPSKGTGQGTVASDTSNATKVLRPQSRPLQPKAVALSDSILDLGPTTNVSIAIPRNDSKLPIITFFGALLVCAVVLLIYGLSGDTHQTSNQLAAIPNGTPDVSEPNVATSEVSQPEANTVQIVPESVEQANVGLPPIPLPQHSEEDVRNSVRTKSQTTTQSADKRIPENERAKAKTRPPQPKPEPIIEVASLASLEREVQLPDIEAKKTSASSGDDELPLAKIGAVNEVTLQNLQISIDQPMVRKFPEIEFYVKQTAGNSKKRNWEIRLKATPTKETKKPGEEVSETKGQAPEGSKLDVLAKDFDMLVALIIFEQDYLQLQWQKVKDRQLAEQLRNCVLLLTSGQEKATVQLRPGKNIGDFVTDLTERNHLYELDDSAVASADAMELRIKSVKLPGTDYQLDPVEAKVGFGDSIEVKLLGWQGDASLRFSLVGKKENPAVRFTPRYKIGTKKNAPLTSGDVRGSIEKMHDALADGRARLAYAQRQVRTLPGDIRSVLSKDDGSNTARVRAAAGQLERQLRSAEGTINRMERSIPDMEATIAGLEALASLARQFDQQGSIEFDVIVPCQSEELVLLTTNPKKN